MIEVLLDEELYDEDFAENWCHGFDEARHLRPALPSRGRRAITGVPAETDPRSLARRLADARAGACPVMYTGLEYSNSGIAGDPGGAHPVRPGRAARRAREASGWRMLGSHFPINRSGNVANPDLGLAVARDRFPDLQRLLPRRVATRQGLVDRGARGRPVSRSAG